MLRLQAISNGLNANIKDTCSTLNIEVVVKFDEPSV